MAVKSMDNKQQSSWTPPGLHLSGQMLIGLLFLVALVSFELFNFDTTRFALSNLLGDVSFIRVRWASVLALAFCAIDFAGLLRFFMPEAEENDTPVEVWYLMGAWLLGATMNALMTWWAVSLALVEHDLGNEILSRQQLLEVVPVFVAVLVWLTRILFIGAFTVAGGYLFDFDQLRSPRTKAKPTTRLSASRPAIAKPSALPRRARPLREAPRRPDPSPDLRLVTDRIPAFLEDEDREQEQADIADESSSTNVIPGLLEQSTADRTRKRPPRS